jgi:hypothetical protein
MGDRFIQGLVRGLILGLELQRFHIYMVSDNNGISRKPVMVEPINEEVDMVPSGDSVN